MCNASLAEETGPSASTCWSHTNHFLQRQQANISVKLTVTCNETTGVVVPGLSAGDCDAHLSAPAGRGATELTGPRCPVAIQ